MYRVVVVLSVVIGLLAGCVSQSRYKALEAQSTEERERMEREIDTLRSERRELEGHKTVLERQLDALRDEVTRRETELSLVNRQLSDLSQESTAQRAELEAQRASLERQLAGLNDRVADTEKQAADLAAQKDEEIRRLRGTYDSLVKDLEGEIVKGEIKVRQIQDRLSVQMMEKILFDSGKAEIKAEGREVLTKVGNVLRTVHDKQIRIEGYTDSVPIGAALRRHYATNWELSTQRATTVLRFLQEKVGVDGKYLAAVGYGEHRPVASNDTDEGRAENRRIEIVLTPLDAPGVSDGAVQASP